LEINARNSDGKIREFIIKVNTQIDVVAFIRAGVVANLGDPFKG
jgi:hypothetical protein